MPKIGLISDTHSYLDDAVFDYFKDVDEIWHAGDIGSTAVLSKLSEFKLTRAVFGNIDDKNICLQTEDNLLFEIEGKKIWMTHIGGRPGRYARGIRQQLKIVKPDIFICGHSHILRVETDKNLNNLLYINPGAAGRHGFHKVRTLIRFDLDNGEIKNMQVIELGPRSELNQ